VKQSTVIVSASSSGRPDFSNLILTVRTIHFTSCSVVVGQPGLPNVLKTLELGDAILFETFSDGILEIRLTAFGENQVEFLVTQVSPRLGLVAGLIDDDPGNSPFSESELARISESITELKEQLKASLNYAPEQLDLISRKLDEIQSASQRLGRKDWLNYVAGTLTGTCISASFAPDVTKSLFKSMGAAFSWLLNNAPVLLQLP